MLVVSNVIALPIPFFVFTIWNGASFNNTPEMIQRVIFILGTVQVMNFIQLFLYNECSWFVKDGLLMSSLIQLYTFAMEAGIYVP